MSSPVTTHVSVTDLLERGRNGSVGSIGRLLSLVERGDDAAHELSRVAYAASAHGFTVGITGPPGVGKSTLTSALIGACRRSGHPVAVLAVDPSSTFSGGAILGDRVRMSSHIDDAGVFIRSLATRGHVGGLSVVTREAARLLHAVGYEWVLIETVGVGQSELEISGAADTTLVVLQPGAGDDVQIAKAGVLEIADVFVVNKADRFEAEEMAQDLMQLVDARLDGPDVWRAPVVKTVATAERGADELWSAIVAHREWLERTGQLSVRRQFHQMQELRTSLVAHLEGRVAELLQSNLGQVVRSGLADRTIDPRSAYERLVSEIDLPQPDR